MTKTRNVLAVTALCALLGPVTACSSDGGSDGDSSSSATPTSGGTSTTKATDCTAHVKLTGAVTGSWSGKATTSATDKQGATYAADHQDTGVLVLPKSGDFPASVSVAAGGTTYTSQAGGGKVKADPKGHGASVDADSVAVVNGKQKTVHVVATFDC